MNATPDIDMQRTHELLERLDATPRPLCTVEGCTHHPPRTRAERPDAQTRTVARRQRVHAKAA
jgi:hypothetical protein